MNRRLTLGSVLGAAMTAAAPVDASIYRVLPSSADVVAGEAYSMHVEVVTQPGDNVIDNGFFSFAIDLGVSGTAGATGSDINNIVLNTADFDDLLGSSLGQSIGDRFIGVAGVTSNFVAPTFGHRAGDITWLFDFDLTIPATAILGDNIILTPSEGAFENLIVSEAFDPVMPQLFEPATLTVVPEPGSALLLALAGLYFLRTPKAAKSG